MPGVQASRFGWCPWAASALGGWWWCGGGGGVRDVGDVGGVPRNAIDDRRRTKDAYLGEVVVNGKPGIVPNSVGGPGSHGTAEKHSGSVCSELGHELWDAVFALDLHGRLESVDWHERHAKHAREKRSRSRLDHDGQRRSRLEAIQELNGTGICCRVSKTRQRTLNQGRGETAIETRNASILVQCTKGVHRASAVAVLVVDRGAHPHQTQHLRRHGNGASSAASSRSSRRVAQNLTQRLDLARSSRCRSIGR